MQKTPPTTPLNTAPGNGSGNEPGGGPGNGSGNGPAPGFSKHPDYKVDLVRFPKTVSLWCDDVKIAETENAICVWETRHTPVLYLPLDDVDPACLERSEHQTYCPFKGTASYWTVSIAGQNLENAIWAYRMPYDEVSELAGYVGFYAKLFTVKADDEILNCTDPRWAEVA